MLKILWSAKKHSFTIDSHPYVSFISLVCTFNEGTRSDALLQILLFRTASALLKQSLPEPDLVPKNLIY